MINSEVGDAKSIHGRTVVHTRFGAAGHAVFGPYVTLEPGSYAVEFFISPVNLGECGDNDVCATIDVAAEHGRLQLASKEITAGVLRGGTKRFQLQFSLQTAAVIEYRIAVDGNAILEADDFRPIVRTPDAQGFDFDAHRFPNVTSSSPRFLQEHEERLRKFYEMSFAVQVENDSVIMSKDDIRFHARCLDDLNLIHEIFIEQVYRFETDRPVTVIDVGMNLGLVSMQFARNPAVNAVHSFEPFPSTFERALANLSLNPDLALKIKPTNAGLGTRSGQVTFTVANNPDTGSQSTRDDENGDTQIALSMVNAAEAVRDIIDKAEGDGHEVIMKIDCEGAEFEIFEELDRAGLMARINALMVEWHRVFPGKTQAALIEPLKRAGFIIFDRSSAVGNGFFYAVRH